MRYLYLFILLSCVSLGNAQDFKTNVTQHFQSQFDGNFQEKVYLHSDKSTYSTGDNIWFKAYVTDATYHISNLLSKFVYVELVNRADSVCSQVKIRQIDSSFFGNIHLSPNLMSGDYCIRAYTNWMKNQDESFFFKKNIKIINHSQNVNIHTHTRQEDNNINTNITLVDSHGKPYKNQRIRTLIKNKHSVIKKHSGRTDDNGQYILNYPVIDSANNFEISFPYNLPFTFKQTLYPLNFPTDFDLQFFPEGGHLLDGVYQKIAFKAISSNGYSEDIEGQIYNSKDSLICHFKSSHRGMGTFKILAKPNEKYYALASNSRGRQNRVELPAPKSNGYALKGEWIGDSIMQVSILSNHTSSSSIPLYFIVHSRAHLMYISSIDKDFIGTIKRSDFPTGINHIVLADSEGNIYSKRLCFIPPFIEDTQLNIQTNKEKYDRRENVHLSMKIDTITNSNVVRNFSIAVVDNNMVKIDSLQNNIISYFLLSSDLKGHIEAPNSYIYEPPAITDILMLTHGWTRFDVKNMIKNTFPRHSYQLELDQQLQGFVTKLSDKPSPNAEIQIFVPSQQLVGMLKTDENGRFIIRDIEFADSTLFIIRGYKEKGGKHVNVRMDQTNSITPHTFFPSKSENIEEKVDDFMKRFNGDYYYQDGVKIYTLEEVYVTARKVSKNTVKYEGEYTDMTDYILGQDKLSKFTATSIYDLIMRLPGVFVTGEKVSIRGGGTPLFLIDGTPSDSDFISHIFPEDVDNIGVIKDGARLSFFGMKGSNGVIVINTKRGGSAGVRPTPGLIKYYPKGYLKPDEFYMPAYNKPEEKNNSPIDYRSTIYWNPNILFDSNGHAEISFYTADLSSTYTIIVEGISSDGKLYHSQKLIQRK